MERWKSGIRITLFISPPKFPHYIPRISQRKKLMQSRPTYLDARVKVSTPPPPPPHHLLPYVSSLRPEPLKLGECAASFGKLKTTEVLSAHRPANSDFSFPFCSKGKYGSASDLTFYNKKKVKDAACLKKISVIHKVIILLKIIIKLVMIVSS